MNTGHLQGDFKSKDAAEQNNICFMLQRFCIKNDQPVAALHLDDKSGILKDYITEDGISYFDLPTMRLLIHLTRHSTFVSFRQYLKLVADDLEERIKDNGSFQLCSSPLSKDLSKPVTVRNSTEEWGGLNNMFGQAIAESKAPKHI